MVADLSLSGLCGARDVLDDHVDKAGRGSKELLADDLEQRLDVNLVGGGRELDAERAEGLLEVGRVLADHLCVQLVDRLEDEVHERPGDVAHGGRGSAKLAGVLVKVDVAPKSRSKLVDVDRTERVRVQLGERLEREAPAHLRGRERDVPELGRESEGGVRVDGADDAVDLLDRVLDLVVGLGGREPELEDEPVHLVDDERDRESLEDRVADDVGRVGHHSLNDVHDEHDSVRDSGSGCDLVDKVLVSGSVDQVEQVRLSARVGQHERHRRRLDRDPSRPRQHVGVGVSDLSNERKTR